MAKKYTKKGNDGKFHNVWPMTQFPYVKDKKFKGKVCGCNGFSDRPKMVKSPAHNAWICEEYLKELTANR